MLKSGNPTPKENPEVFCSDIYLVTNKKELPENQQPIDSDFFTVLKRRRSSNKIGRLTDQDLSNVLSHAVRPVSLAASQDGYYTSLRPSPSAGARHPIDILIINPNAVETDDKIQLYNPLDHSLNSIEIDSHELKKFIDHVNKNKQIQDSTLIWFSIQKGKTSSKYHNPESLFWRDCGALLMCLQLVATAFNLKTCPIGTLGLPHFNRIVNSNEIQSGGGILIGK